MQLTDAVLTDAKLVDAMRSFVTASNRLETLSGRPGVDLRLLEQVEAERKAAGSALQEALVSRGWRRPSY